MLDDLRALVEFAEAGSITGAAQRLHRTPSAVTRQIQRLEATLGAELLDRSAKPPRLNALGARVLDEARDMIARAQALKALASSTSEPHGLMRVGIAHALAEDRLVRPIRALAQAYPKVAVRLISDLTSTLLERLSRGELDVAAVLLPEDRSAPLPLVTKVIASDRMQIVQAANGQTRSDWKSMSAVAWVLNPPGCFLRARLVDHMQREGFAPTIAAEVHNMHLQRAFVEAGHGVGLLPARFADTKRRSLKTLKPPGFDLRMSVAVVRAGPLGAAEKAALLLEDGLAAMFEARRSSAARRSRLPSYGLFRGALQSAALILRRTEPPVRHIPPTEGSADNATPQMGPIIAAWLATGQRPNSDERCKSAFSRRAPAGHRAISYRKSM